MATPVYKHQDDDGDLSIFASGNTLLIACEHGHFWMIECEQHTSRSVRSALEASLDADQVTAMLRQF